MHLSHSLPISEAAKQAGVNRKTIQRWLKKGGMLKKDEHGRVNLEHVRICMLTRTAGRKAHGEKFNLFWRSGATPSQSRFCSNNGLKVLLGSLEEAAIFHTARGKNADFIATLEKAIDQARTFEQWRKDGDFFWSMMTKELASGIDTLKARVTQAANAD